jgi:hypothetical protein
VVTVFGFKAVFALSGIGRFLAALIFARGVPDLARETVAPFSG